VSEYGYGHPNSKTEGIFWPEDLAGIGLPADQAAFLDDAVIGGMPDNYEAPIHIFEEVEARF
jgi:hypothetical protein